jgi:Zn-finger nucleic acid-binding protein
VQAGIEGCPQCGGLFADNATSARIVAVLDQELLRAADLQAEDKRPVDTRPELLCPHCLEPMQRSFVTSAATSVDACPVHGTWFDAFELQHVMRAFASRRRKGLRTGPRPAAPVPQKDLTLPDVFAIHRTLRGLRQRRR